MRDATSAANANAASRVARQAAFLMSDGHIRSLDGSGYQQFDIPSVQYSLFAIVYQRNHLSILSANPLAEAGGIYSYDFTTGTGQAYNGGQKEIAPGVWGMFAGDMDASGLIDQSDKNSVWNTDVGKTGYRVGDADLSSQIENKDKNDFWLPNLGTSSQVPE